MRTVPTYKFVNWEVSPPLEITEPESHVKAGTARYDMENGQNRNGGYVYDWRPFLRKFLYKSQYYGWQEAYAPNRTYIRKNRPYRIFEIVEIANPHNPNRSK
jgi:hypothetical protein